MKNSLELSAPGPKDLVSDSWQMTALFVPFFPCPFLLILDCFQQACFLQNPTQQPGEAWGHSYSRMLP